MSYEIIYNRQFIKVDENRVIPFLQMGSNNCYDAIGNGRRRARSWGNSYSFTNGSLIVENSLLLSEIDKFEQETKNRCEENVKEYDDSWAYDEKKFGYHVGVSFYGKTTRSTSFSAFKSYYANAIKGALTIEQLIEHDVRFRIYPYKWKDTDITDKGLEVKPDVTFLSTHHMLETIEEYENYYRGTGVTLYISVNSEYLLDRVIKNLKPKKVKRTKEVIQVDKFYVLENQLGYFVRNLKHGYKYSYMIGSATKKFLKESDAIKYLDKIKSGGNFKVKLIQTDYLMKV